MGPQLENGYTKIADAILENIAKSKLNGTQFRILMIVWRSTYGWNKKSFALSESYLANATGINKQQIKRELKEMISKGILIETKAPTFNTSREIQFNKHYVESTEVSKKIPVSENDTTTGIELDTTTGSGLDTQKRELKKHIKKQENYFENEELNKTFLEFIQFRKQIKKPMSELSITKLINKLNLIADSDKDKIKILDNSIINNWQGVFPLKENSIVKDKSQQGPQGLTYSNVGLTREKGMFDE